MVYVEKKGYKFNSYRPEKKYEDLLNTQKYQRHEFYKNQLNDYYRLSIFDKEIFEKLYGNVDNYIIEIKKNHAIERISFHNQLNIDLKKIGLPPINYDTVFNEKINAEAKDILFGNSIRLFIFGVFSLTFINVLPSIFGYKIPYIIIAISIIMLLGSTG